MLAHMEERHAAVCTGTSPLSSMLMQAPFERELPFVFERYIQLWSSVYRSTSLSRKQLDELDEFIRALDHSFNSDRTRGRLGVFVLSCGTLNQAIDLPSLAVLEPRALAGLRKRNGCFEFEPFHRDITAEARLKEKTVRPKRATLMAIDGKFPASQYCPIDVLEVESERNFKINNFLLLNKYFASKFMPYDNDPRSPTQKIGSIFYELYSNIVEHAIFRSSPDVRATRRHISVESFALSRDLYASDPGNWSAQSDGISRYFKRLQMQYQSAKLTCINIADDGPGVVEHYRSFVEDSDDDETLLKRIILEQLSSIQSDDTGQGMPNALEAVFALDGLLSIRTNGEWIVASRADNAKSRRSSQLNSMSFENATLASTSGTVYTIIVPTSKIEHAYSR